jgi:hypothetical protein
MKKVALILLFAIISKFSTSQTDMITALETIGEDVVYTEYLFVTITAGQKNSISTTRYVTKLKLEKNRFGKTVGFNAIETKDGNEAKIKYDYMYNKFDNYTHPSYMTAAADHAYVIINGVIFYLEHFDNTTSFDIAQVWMPKVPKARAEEAIFQGGKMSDLAKADLMKLIKDYFVEMKKIQEANPYNEKAQEEADAMKFTVDSTQLTYNNANASYWGSEEGQKKLAALRSKKEGDGWVVIKNTGKKEMNVITDKGTSSHIAPGATSKWPCATDIYYCTMDSHNTWNVKGALIVKGKEYCGKIFEVKND